MNTQLWDSELWSCDDLCGRAGGWCERAAYMSNNHCGSDVHEEYELSCDQGIRDIRTWGGEPSHTLCWCRADETDHWWHYYHEDDDDDGDGATELVRSGGLVAIGLTFTGISIAAIANAFQEQCALGPTIVYEAGTTHPYYILTKSMHHRDQDIFFGQDSSRRVAAQGLPQVLRGCVGEGQAGAETRPGPDVLLQTEVEPFCRRPIAAPPQQTADAWEK